MEKLIGNKWDDILHSEFESDYFIKLQEFLTTEYAEKVVYPVKEDIYNALSLTPPENVKVVLLGQDPYINPGQAHGLAFSVKEGVTPPPSLKNMYKELNTDLGIPMAKTGCLISWAKQGVLLLNTVLTVEEGKSNSHAKHGWEKFTDAVIKYIGSQDAPVVFILWGKNAHLKEAFIKSERQLVLKAPHPSPLSASTGFFGCRHFSKVNKFLKENNITEINWAL